MATARIGEAKLAATPQATRKTTRFGQALASSPGILVIVPGLVALVGIFLTLAGDRALRRSNLEMAGDRLSEETRLVATSVRHALDQSSPVLDRLAAAARAHQPSQPFEALAHTLADLMHGRPGVAYVSISFPDGTFQGAYQDDDGVIRFQDSRVEPDGAGTRVRRYHLEGATALRLQREERTSYDPRQREFYRLAVERGGRVWTKPYPFFKTHYTGITRAEAIYEGPAAERRLHAVVTVDFDVNLLSSYLRGRQLPGMRALLYTGDGTLLGYPQGAEAIQRLPLRSDRPLRPEDLQDPVLSAFFAAVEAAKRSNPSNTATKSSTNTPSKSTANTAPNDPPNGAPSSASTAVSTNASTSASNGVSTHASNVGKPNPPDPQLALRSIESQGERFLTSVVPASGDEGLAWYVAFIVPEAYFLRGVHQYERSSLLIGTIAVASAMIIAWLFARHIVRVQREAVEARAQAQAARAAAHELGSYRLVASLGRGGMGEVWKAEHRLLARQAAIKLIKPDASGLTSPELRTRFRREAETLASLRSRNTIELFDYGVSEDGTFYFVMELLDGMDLESLVNAYGPQPAARVIHILIQACNSLAEAHEAGLVHRDIKPANLFLCRAADEHDIVKVLDFGLVRAVTGAPSAGTLERSGDMEPLSRPLSSPFSAPASRRALGAVDPDLTQAGGLMGTPGYMAPEQALGHTLDHRADLYALGCVAFWLLTGRLVFEDPNPMRLMLAHVNTPTPDIRAAIEDAMRSSASGSNGSNGSSGSLFLPDDLVTLITTCLAKSPADRPSGARELGQALRAIAIPPEQAWTERAMAAWWNKHRPRRRSLRGPADASREFNVAVTLP